MNSCLLIAGEKSGEEHAMSFYPELCSLCPDTAFYGVGGDELQKHGLELLYHLKDFSSMGFSEVIRKIPFYFRAISHIEKEVKNRNTKTAILIDFQDFNLRLAQKLKKQGVNVLYYVAPQAWAWKAHRAQTLAQNVHTLFTILPFEKQWFRDRGVNQVKAIAHPLMRTYQGLLDNLPVKPHMDLKKKLKLLLLPGSRRYEVNSLLPVFIEVARVLRKKIDVEIHLVKVSHISQEIYQYYQSEVDVWYESDELVKGMREAHVALATSGTVTLSTGLFELPTIVCYKSSLLNEFIFRNFIKYQGAISLTNIVQNEMVFPEYTQDQANTQQLTRVIWSWIESEKVYNEIKTKLKKTKHLLSGEDFSVPQYMSRVIHG